jgi:hypothetical protein
MVGLFLLPLLVFGCFVLMKQGFSEDGIPLTGKKRVTGTAGKTLGVLCGVIGLAVLILWLLMVKGSMMS